MAIPGSVPSFEYPWPTLQETSGPMELEPLVLAVGIKENNVVIHFQAGTKSLNLCPEMAKAFAELVWRKAEEAGG